MTPEEELNKEQQKMLIRAIGIAFVATILILTFITMLANQIIDWLK